MYVARIPNRGSPPAILLRESYRQGGKVKNRTLANLSHWPEPKVDALAQTLKGLPPKLDLSQAFEITRSLPHGHVAAVLGTAERFGLVGEMRRELASGEHSAHHISMREWLDGRA